MPNSSMHTHLRSISRVNILLAVFVLVGVAFLYAWFKWSLLPIAEEQAQTASQDSTEVAEEQNIVDQTELTVEYRKSVHTLFVEYNFEDSEASSAQLQELLSVTVPVGLQDFHLELAICLTAAQNGNPAEATELFNLLQEKYDWFVTDEINT